MPATAGRLGFMTKDVRHAVAGPDAAVTTRYGDTARDTKEPLECFFDHVADAIAVAQERLDLLSSDRRCLTVEISGAKTGLALIYNLVIPIVRVIDEEKAVDLNAAIVDLASDYDAGHTIVTVLGIVMAAPPFPVLPHPLPVIHPQRHLIVLDRQRQGPKPHPDSSARQANRLRFDGEQSRTRSQTGFTEIGSRRRSNNPTNSGGHYLHKMGFGTA